MHFEAASQVYGKPAPTRKRKSLNRLTRFKAAVGVRKRNGFRAVLLSALQPKYNVVGKTLNSAMAVHC